MRDVDLSDTDLDLLDKDIPSKHYVGLQDVFKTCLQNVFKSCLQDVLKTCLQNVFKTYLQDVFKTSWKTKNYYAEDVLKTSSRRLQDQQMFAGQFLCHLSLLRSVLIAFSGIVYLGSFLFYVNSIIFLKDFLINNLKSSSS